MYNKETIMSEEIEVSELAQLRELADSLGITYTARTSIDTLQRKIKEVTEPAEVDTVSVDEVLNAEVPLKRKSLRQHLYDTEMALVRVRVTCLDPKKKDLRGEFITVCNNHLGTVRKYVPFGESEDDGWHIPKCIYTVLKESVFLSIRTVKDKKTGREELVSSYVPQYVIEVLPPLTKKELNDLATAQAAAGE